MHFSLCYHFKRVLDRLNRPSQVCTGATNCLQPAWSCASLMLLFWVHNFFSVTTAVAIKRLFLYQRVLTQRYKFSQIAAWNTAMLVISVIYTAKLLRTGYYVWALMYCVLQNLHLTSIVHTLTYCVLRITCCVLIFAYGNSLDCSDWLLIALSL